MLKQFVRLYLSIVIPVIVLTLCALFVSDRFFLHNAFEDKIRGRMQHRYSWVQEQLAEIPRDRWQATIDSARRLYPTGLELATEAMTLATVRPSPSEQARFERGDVAFAPLPNGMTYAFQKIDASPLVIGSQLSFSDSNTLDSYVYLLLFAALMSAPILWFWFRPFWRDLRRLSDVTDRIGSGQFSVSGSPVRSATVQPFAIAIDRMAARIHELLESQKRLTSSVAHELTTPITQLVFALELFKESGLGADAAAVIVGMESDLKELESLVAELLEYARLEHSSVFEPEEISLDSLLARVVESSEHLPAAGKSIALVEPTSGLGRVRCDAHQMHRAVFNLLRNALLYAATRVQVSAERHGERTCIHVDDDGPGIPSSESRRLFEPFARLDASRARHTGGYGLGLAIVQQVAKLHGGSAMIAASPLGGARVTIAW